VADAHLLFTEHQHGVFRYLCRLLGQPETARDLTQEVFLRVTRATVPNADAVALRAWTFRIARNLALNHLRDGRRRPVAVELPELARSANQEVRAAVREAIAALADLDRDVFVMRELAGLSYEDIAAACDLTTDAVRARLRRARETLRATLSAPLDAQRQHGIRLNKGDH
jgi:RNA polymerase sigma-70 factor (ECF subfamily)